MLLMSESLLVALQEGHWLSLLAPALATALCMGLGLLYFTYSPHIPSGSPKRVKFGEWPIVGAWDFFSRRKEFFDEAIAKSTTGQFSFGVGKYHVIGLSGTEGRKKFLETKELSFTDGYQALFNGSPSQPEKREVGEESSFSKHFNNRLITMMKRDTLNNCLPHLVGDTKDRLTELANQETKITDPFESIYAIVFQLTMRTVGCTELAEDDARRAKMLHLFEMVEESASPSLIIFPWLPSLGKFKRLSGGAQIYKLFQTVINERNKTGRRENDALQFQMDHGDDTIRIISVS